MYFGKGINSIEGRNINQHLNKTSIEILVLSKGLALNFVASQNFAWW